MTARRDGHAGRVPRGVSTCRHSVVRGGCRSRAGRAVHPIQRVPPESASRKTDSAGSGPPPPVLQKSLRPVSGRRRIGAQTKRATASQKPRA